MNTYTLVLYKPDSEDYFHGYLEASYPSDFELRTGIDEEFVIEFVSEHFARSLGYSEAGYTAYLMSTSLGEPVTYEFSYNSSPSVYGWESENFQRICNLINERTKKIIEDKEEAEKKDKAHEKEVARRATVAREKKQLEELKLKYEQST